MIPDTLFVAVVVSAGSLGTALAALAYYSRVHLERPAIGTFNTRDIVVLSVFIVLLPVLYLHVPQIVLTGFLILTFASALGIGLRPVLAAPYRRILIPVLIGSEILVTYRLLGTANGLKLYWVLTSTIVLIAAMSVSNLYVQGGLRIRQVAGLALFLALYDLFFSLVIPLTPQLALAFEGRPLNASIGWASGGRSANVGLGDLLVYGLFATAAFKEFGSRGSRSALATIFVFGALAPTLAPLVISHFNQGTDGVVVPAQTFFGPAAFAVSLLLHRRARPRTAPAARGQLASPLAVAG